MWPGCENLTNFDGALFKGQEERYECIDGHDDLCFLKEIILRRLKVFSWLLRR